MAPRRPRKSAAPSPPPPSQHDPSHPLNLRRSLNRNDVEIAALVKLNKSLHVLREAIVEEFGEETLIELATKNDDELGDVEEDQGERLRQLSTSFKARMRLRRRLLNRLSRRLYRVAYIMDGNAAAATPPLPPLYGDEIIRFKKEGQEDDFDEDVRIVEEGEVKEYIEGEEKREEVWRMVGEARRKRMAELAEKSEDVKSEEEAPEVPSSSKVEKQTNAVELILRGDKEDRALLDQLVEYDVGYDKTTVTTPSTTTDVTKIETNTINPLINTTDNHEVTEEGEYASKSAASERIAFSFHYISKSSMPPRERSADWKRWTKEMSIKIPEQVTFEDVETKVFDLERRLEDAKRKREEVKEERPRGEGKVLRRKSAFDEAVEEGEKTGGDEGGGYGDEAKDKEEGVLSRDSEVEDSEGADDDAKVTKNVSEVEVSNDSEGAEEDAKAENESGSEVQRVLQSKDEVGGDEAKKESEVNEEMKDVLDESADEEKAAEYAADSEKPSEEKAADAIDEEKANIEPKEIEVPDVKPPKSHNRIFSLQPVPSFYVQDMRRLELIQMEIYQSSQSVNYQRKLQKAQAAYDAAFEKSMALQQQKALAVSEVQKMIQNQDKQLNAVKQKATNDLLRAKQVWENRQRSYNQFRNANGEAALQLKLTVQDSLTRLVDRVCIREEQVHRLYGTKLTRDVIRQARESQDPSHADRAVVANVLGLIVDSVERYNDEMLSRNPEFIPPIVETEHNSIVDPNTKESMVQYFRRTRVQMTQRTDTLGKLFEEAEKARAAAWSEVAKCKAMLGAASAAAQPKSKNRKSTAPAPRARPQQMIPQQQFVVPAQRNQPTGIPMQMTASANSAFAAPASQRPNVNPGVIIQSAVAANANAAAAMIQSANQNQAVAMLSRPANQPQPNQGQTGATRSRSTDQSQNPDGTVKMTQQEKYGYGDRYSFQNVQARKNDDGTVVPVTAPKMLPDGTFQRPIGRQRKGMEWDAVRGVWIPDTGRSSMQE